MQELIPDLESELILCQKRVDSMSGDLKNIIGFRYQWMKIYDEREEVVPAIPMVQTFRMNSEAFDQIFIQRIRWNLETRDIILINNE